MISLIFLCYNTIFRRIKFNIIFAGTPDFASVALESLIQQGHTISLVLTKPDAISGRGNQLRPSSVKEMAIKYNIPVHQPSTLKSEETFELLKAQDADFMVVAAYGLIIPQRILDIPKNGCLNIHGSLLPRWRGAAPIQRALLAGDKTTGITIIQMDSGLDTGDMLLKYPVTIDEYDTTGSLYDKLTLIGAAAINACINEYFQIIPEKQNNLDTCYAEKLTKEEAKIDWNDEAALVVRKIRGYNPIPGAFTFLNDKLLRVWKAELIHNEEHTYQAGEFVSLNNKEFLVACSKGIIALSEVQLPGSKRLEIKSFLSGYKKSSQTKFE